MNLKKYQDCINDCLEALKINPLMIKAIDRKSKALEALGLYRDALIDATACLFISNFLIWFSICFCSSFRFCFNFLAFRKIKLTSIFKFCQGSSNAIAAEIHGSPNV